jgi:hypothetical protein
MTLAAKLLEVKAALDAHVITQAQHDELAANVMRGFNAVNAQGGHGPPGAADALATMFTQQEQRRLQPWRNTQALLNAERKSINDET